MLETTRKLIDEYYKCNISSQKLIAHIDKFEQSRHKLIYDEYFDITDEQYCSICNNKINYTGFKKGYQCNKSCETKKYVNSLTDNDIIDIVKNKFIEYGGYTKSFGLEFKKFENRLSSMYFSALGPELKYCVINDIKDKPKCEVCEIDCHFSLTKNRYAKGCKSHIMVLENHKWEQVSKDKMINSIKQTRELKLLGNPNYFKEIGQKVSESISKLTKEEKLEINATREKTNLEKYGVRNVSQNEEIKFKKKETLFNNFGVTTVWKLQCVIDKTRETNIQSGHWISDCDKSFAQLYYEKVWKFTNKQELKSLNNFDKRGRIDLIDSAHHLDHKFSIKEGFKNNLLPYYIGHINNLEMLPARENCSKGSKCSISSDILIGSILN